MNTTFRTTLASTLTLLATGLLSPVSASSQPPAAINPVLNVSLIRCVDSHFSKSLGTCGGDALVSGRIALTPTATLIKTEGALADPFNLYEVYWLALGDSLPDAVPAGNFVTDCKGNARGALTTITTANEALNPAITSPVVIYPTAGYLSAGVFLVYSRGPWGHDNDGDCVADTYNTVSNGADTDASHTLVNPPVTLGIDDVQFLSGYSFPSSAPGSESGEIPPEIPGQADQNVPTLPVVSPNTGSVFVPDNFGQAAQGNSQQAPMNNMPGNFGQSGQGNSQQAPMNNMPGNFGQPGRGNGQQAPMNNIPGNFGQPGRGNGQQAPMKNAPGNFGQSGQGNSQQAPMNNMPGNFGQSGQGNSQQAPMNNMPGNFGQSGQGNSQQAPMNNMPGNFGQSGQGNSQQAPMNNMPGNFGQSGQGNSQQAPMNNMPGNFGQSGQGNSQQAPMNNMPGNFGQSGQGNGQIPVVPATENPDAQQIPVQEGGETTNRKSMRRSHR